jgi:alkyl hydroperoxide reductase subunit F
LPHCDGPLFKGKRVAVIGGGNRRRGGHRPGRHRRPCHAGRVRQPTARRRRVADQAAQLPNVTIITSALTTEVKGDGSKVSALVYKDRNAESFHTVELEGIFVQIGLVPNTEWLKGTIALSPRGEIEIDAHGATSLPGVYAAGDCTTVPYKQIIIAMGAGATAGLSAFDHLIRLPVADEAKAA